MSETNDANAQGANDPGQQGPDPFAGPSWSGDRPFPGRSEGASRERRKRRSGATSSSRKNSGRRTKGEKKRSPRRRLITIGSGVVGLLVLLSLAWLVFSGFKARSELESVRSGVAKMRTQITAGDLTGARATAKSVKGHADDASLFTSGPVWAIGAAVPYLGDPMDTARSLTSSVKLVADQALPPLIDASNDLRPGQLRQPDGTFDLKPIQALGPTLLNAGSTMRAALSDAQNASGSTWLSPVNNARSELINQITPLSATVDNIGQAARILPPLLGADGAKNYMISFENDAEIRGAGGVPGSFAIIHADQGKVTFTKFESDVYFVDKNTTAPANLLGNGFRFLYPAATLDYRDSDYSPHFPYAAQIWESMWAKRNPGQQLDGAMIIDPTALSYLLKVSGPVTLPRSVVGGGTIVSSANVIQLTQQQLYTLYPDVTGPKAAHEQAERKQYLINIAEAVSGKILGPGVDTTQLVHAGGQAANQHRLLFWANDKSVETEIASLPLGGTVPAAADPTAKQPYVAVALNNNANSKLDYYLHSSLSWQRTGCGAMRDVTITLTLTNLAPSVVPPYADNQIDLPHGESQFDVAIYGSIGGTFTSESGITRSRYGAASTAGHDLGHPVYVAHFINVARGQTKTLVFHEKEPAGQGKVVVRDQPMVNPMTVTTKESSC